MTTGCANNEVIVEYETIELTRDRFVSVPEALTRPVEIVDLVDNDGKRNADTLQLGAAYRAQKVRARQCNGQLAEIAALGENTQEESEEKAKARRSGTPESLRENNYYFTAKP